MLLCLFGKITLLRFVRENVALVGHWFLPSTTGDPVREQPACLWSLGEGRVVKYLFTQWCRPECSRRTANCKRLWKFGLLNCSKEGGINIRSVHTDLGFCTWTYWTPPHFSHCQDHQKTDMPSKSSAFGRFEILQRLDQFVFWICSGDGIMWVWAHGVAQVALCRIWTKKQNTTAIVQV